MSDVLDEIPVIVFRLVGIDMTAFSRRLESMDRDVTTLVRRAFEGDD